MKTPRFLTGSSSSAFVFFLIIFLLGSAALPQTMAQSRSRKVAGGLKKSIGKAKTVVRRRGETDVNQTGETVGKPTTGEPGVGRTTEEIMQAQQYAAPSKRPAIIPEHEAVENDERKQNPDAPAVSRFPFDASESFRTKKQRGSLIAGVNTSPDAPQTVSTNFTGATLADTRAFPPDTMGAVGPSQFVVFVNGRIRTFNKTTGVADGVIDADPDVFFSSVETPTGGAVAVNFTSDPNVRYDRLSGRWFLTIIDVPCTTSTCATTTANRILIAVSDAASSAALTGSTVWTYYYVQQDTTGGVASTGEFLDYPSLGIDANALYIGGNMFSSAGSFAGTNAYVIRKSSVLNGGPVVATVFRGLTNGSTEGPYAPRGVDNYDPAATEGYFIGTSIIAYSRLDTIRVSNPGGTPSISGNLLTTVPTTGNPRSVDHFGNTLLTAGRLDALDDRLFAAHIRNGRLWTAHNISVLPTGVGATAGATRRDAVRWYELAVPTGAGAPTVNQSGTIFDNAATTAAARQYWIPSAMVSGQGHAAFGYSTAGTPYYADAATNGRLASDALGTSQAVNIYTTATTPYNPPSDTGGTSGRRWGDYSFVSLDPKDDMTMWTIQEFCSSANNYGVRAAKLLAPPPASIADGPGAGGAYNVPANQTSVNVTITGTSVAGSGFFDPGADLAAPALPFNHISATVSGANVTVNSVTYNSPTSITLNLNTVGASFAGRNSPASPTSLRDLTVTNPDGQTVTRAAVINIAAAPTAGVATISGRAVTRSGRAINNARITVTDTATLEKRIVLTNANGYFRVSNLQVGDTFIVAVSHKFYEFAQKITAFDLNEDAEFTFVGGTQ